MGTVMRDDTSQRSHRLAVTQPVHPTTTTTRSPRTAARPESPLTFLSRPRKMVIRVDQMRMERHHDSQRSGRLAITFDDVRVVDRMAASIASLPRLGFDGSMMKRHGDSQRSGRWPVTFGDLGDLRVVDRVVASIACLPRLGFDRSMMTRHDDSQRSDRLAVTVGDVRVVDRVAASRASLLRLGSDGSEMKRHDDSQRSDGLPVTFAHLGDPHESLTARRAYASVPHLGFDGWS